VFACAGNTFLYVLHGHAVKRFAGLGFELEGLGACWTSRKLFVVVDELSGVSVRQGEGGGNAHTSLIFQLLRRGTTIIVTTFGNVIGSPFWETEVGTDWRKLMEEVGLAEEVGLNVQAILPEVRHAAHLQAMSSDE
jgi:hypothetical protein